MYDLLRSMTAPSVLSLALLLGACSGSGDKKKKEDDEDVVTPSEAVETPAEKSATSDSNQTPARATGQGRALDEVQKAFDVRKESFRKVNSTRLSQNAGTLAVTVTFAPSGEVVECRMLSTDFREDPAFNAAVMAEVWRVRLAPRADVGEFTVASYPIAFSARSEAIATPPSMPIVSPVPPAVAPAPRPY